MKKTPHLFGILAAACFVTSVLHGATIPGTSVTPSVWLDASQLLLGNGDPVHPWPDVSGNGRNATATHPSRKPFYRSNVVNGHPVVRFNSELHAGGAANQFLSFQGPLANNEEGTLSLYIVARDSVTRTAASNGRSTLLNTRTNANTANGSLFGFGASPAFQTYAHVGRNPTSGGSLQVTPVNSDGFNVLGLTRNGLTATLFNYTDTDHSTTTTTWSGFVPSTLTTTQIGTEGGAHYFFGDIAEIIVVEGANPSAADHLQTVRYLGQKYNIAFAANAQGDGYTAWKTANAPNTGNNPNADEDGDGVTNGVEYVLGGLVGTMDRDKLPGISTSGGDMLFTFMRDQASIDDSTVVTIQTSTDLTNWSAGYPVPSGPTANNPGVTVVKDTPAGFDTVTLKLPLIPDVKFVRLSVIP